MIGPRGLRPADNTALLATDVVVPDKRRNRSEIRHIHPVNLGYEILYASTAQDLVRPECGIGRHSGVAISTGIFG